MEIRWAKPWCPVDFILKPFHGLLNSLCQHVSCHCPHACPLWLFVCVCVGGCSYMFTIVHMCLPVPKAFLRKSVCVCKCVCVFVCIQVFVHSFCGHHSIFVRCFFTAFATTFTCIASARTTLILIHWLHMDDDGWISTSLWQSNSLHQWSFSQANPLSMGGIPVSMIDSTQEFQPHKGSARGRQQISGLTPAFANRSPDMTWLLGDGPWNCEWIKTRVETSYELSPVT